MHVETSSIKLSEKTYLVQALQSSPFSSSSIQITDPKNGSTIVNPYRILKATTGVHYNLFEVFVNNRTDYQSYSAKGDGMGHWSLDMTGLLVPGRNNVTTIAAFYPPNLKPSLNSNSTIPGFYLPSNNNGSWVYSKIHFDLAVPAPAITTPAGGDKIPIDSAVRPIISGTVDEHYVYVGLSVNMYTTNASGNRIVGEYYNDSIPQNGTGFWFVKLPGGDSIRPGLQRITVWIPYLNLIGEPTVKIFGKPIFVTFVCSNRNVVMNTHFCSH
ncbi:MAG TPA: hypothetical protein VFI73_07940 [Candidatus Nitrosopolaris sp.]|nr:hypothetical protein [Candidatus Nitrosopolaris sp.]